MVGVQRILPQWAPAFTGEQQDMANFRYDRWHEVLPHVLNVLNSAVSSQLMTESSEPQDEEGAAHSARDGPDTPAYDKAASSRHGVLQTKQTGCELQHVQHVLDPADLLKIADLSAEPFPRSQCGPGAVEV